MKQKSSSLSALPSDESSFRELIDKRIEESRNELAFFSMKTVSGDKSYWEGCSWSDVHRDMLACMYSLVAIGVKAGDRVGYYGHCSYEQVILFYSLMYMDVRIVTWFSNLHGQALVDHVPALIFVEKYSQFLKVKRSFTGCKASFPDGFRAVVIFPVMPSGSSMVRGYSPFSDERLLPWSAFLRRGRGISPRASWGLEGAGADTVVLDSFSPISGGAPVSLSRRVLLSAARAGWGLLRPRASDALLHFSHPAAVTSFHVTQLFPLFSPFSLYLLPRAAWLFSALGSVQPTLLCAHADFWGALYAALAQLCPDAKLAHLSPRALARLRGRVGLTRLRLGLSSGAAAPYALALYYAKLGVSLTEVYGVTRAGGVLGAVHLAKERRYAVPRLRPLLPVRIARDSLELEAEVAGEWVATGDAAEVGETPEGPYFRVLGNMQDALCPPSCSSEGEGEGEGGEETKTTNATKTTKTTKATKTNERLWPAYAETQFRGSPLIRQAFVDLVGGLCVAVLVIDPWVCKRMAGIRGLYPKEFVQSSEVGALLRKVCLEINLARSGGGGGGGFPKDLQQGKEKDKDGGSEQQPQQPREEEEGGWSWPRAFPIRRFTVVPRFLSVRRGELTPVMTINRRVLRESLREELAELASQAPLGGLVHRSLSPMPSVTAATMSAMSAMTSSGSLPMPISAGAMANQDEGGRKKKGNGKTGGEGGKDGEDAAAAVDYVQTESQEFALREGRLTDGVFYLRAVRRGGGGETSSESAPSAAAASCSSSLASSSLPPAGVDDDSSGAGSAISGADAAGGMFSSSEMPAPMYTPSKFEIAQVEKMEEELQERMAELRGNVNQLKRLQEESDALQRKLQDEQDLTKQLQAQLKKAKKRSKSK